jgi:WD40 repeat protein
MLVIQPHTACVNVVCFTPDGSRFASVSQDGWAKMWNPTDLHTAKPVWEVLGDAFNGLDPDDLDDNEFFVLGSGGLSHAQFTNDGKHLITSGWQRHVRAWSAKTGKELWHVTNPQGWGGVGTLVVSRDGKYLAFAGGQIDIPEQIYIVDLKTKEIAKSVSGHGNACGALAAGPEGLVSGGADKHVKFWSWETGRCYYDMSLRGVVRGLMFSPDGSRLAASGGALVMVWDMPPPERKNSRRKPDKLREFRGHEGQVQYIDFSPDGKTIASAAHDGTVRVWDTVSGEEIRAFAPKVGKLHHVAFAPDGMTLAFGSERGHVGLLDLDN